MFDLSLTKILVLAVIALIVFGPNELPKVASQAGRFLRDLRKVAENAKADLREGLGPEFQDFDFEDLNPKRFVAKHLMDEETATGQRALLDELKSTSTAISTGVANALNGGSPTTATATDARPTLRDGDDPPFDVEAT